MTKIKGAIEVIITNSADGVPEVYGIYQTDSKANGLAFTHADLEAYVQERERKAFDAARQRILLASGYIKEGKQYNLTTSDKPKYKTFEDFKKENHE